VDDGVSNVALDAASIGDDEGPPALESDADGLQDVSRDPGELTARIDEGVGHVLHDPAVRDALDANRRSEDSHLRHCSTPSLSPSYQYIAIRRTAMHLIPLQV